ncbi:LOW QUALITY PROTEIN: Zinc finger protein 25, partial [Galemys pyrenaicus]
MEEPPNQKLSDVHTVDYPIKASSTNQGRHLDSFTPGDPHQEHDGMKEESFHRIRESCRYPEQLSHQGIKHLQQLSEFCEQGKALSKDNIYTLKGLPVDRVSVGTPMPSHLSLSKIELKKDRVPIHAVKGEKLLIYGEMSPKTFVLIEHQKLQADDQLYECGEIYEILYTVDIRTLTTEELFGSKNQVKTFSWKTALTLHLHSQRGVKHFKITHKREIPYECQKCGKILYRESTLIIHQKSHSREKSCEFQVCRKTLQKSDFTRHQRTHTGEKPYVCQECGKTFMDKSNLTRDQRSHTGLKSYACQELGRLSPRRHISVNIRGLTLERSPVNIKNMGKLLPISHTSIDISKYTINTMHVKSLGKLSGKSTLTKQRIHTGEKSNGCQECGKISQFDTLRQRINQPSVTMIKSLLEGNECQ